MQFNLLALSLILFSSPLFSSESWEEIYPEAPDGSKQTVDVVFTWVDGSDEEWIQERNRWALLEGKEAISVDGLNECRFRDGNELKFALRSVHENAPFVRHIFIVTSGQTPVWLKAHPKITVVPHAHFFRDARNLPTFNSHAIETNIQAIYRLSERYIYMNDDVFLGQTTKYENFYSKDGEKFKIFLSKNRKLPTGNVQPSDSGYIAGGKNVTRVLDEQFGQKERYVHSHTPFPQIKSVVLGIESQFKNIFIMNSQCRFRSIKDYAITNALIPYMALYQGKAEEGNAARMTVNFGKDYESDAKKLKKLMSGEYTFFCLNDSFNRADPRSQLLVSQFLQIYFPNPAPWEKQGDEIVQKGLFNYAKKVVKKKVMSHKKRLSSLKKMAGKLRK